MRRDLFGNFRRGVIWNLAAIWLMALSGAALNFLIGRFYGPATLGIYNQVLAVYVVLSQLSVGGVHLSVLRHASEHSVAGREFSDLVASAARLVLLIGCAIGGIAYFLSGAAGRYVESPGVATGIVCIAPGLVCFSLNKVLLAAVNGLRHMRAYAVLSALRWVLVVGYTYGLYAAGASGILLPAALTAAESTLLIFLIVYVSRLPCALFTLHGADWVRRHAAFGMKAFLSGTLTELNARVDVLMLGYLRNDILVGIYSMAAMVGEGLAQIPVAVQSSLNPILTRLVAAGERAGLKALARKCNAVLLPAMALLGGVAFLCYPSVVAFLTEDSTFRAGQAAFGLLALGIALVSGYVPFRMLMNQSGHPACHSLLLAGNVMTNALLNAVLIPPYGAAGAAAGSSIAAILSVVYLKVLARRVLDISV